ncbi:bactofilin family protein [Terriglobus albidus]|uniref:polymer-forming cytoskeletal protein n=1 Tax=Terriglobus albidus TaxID=1592106 RepID=UPI0021E04687|nr:polymer-forming cytoskeletal protein [Terriglobus albidus]
MRRLPILAAVSLLSISAVVAHARSSEDRAGVGNHIIVGENETVGDVACVFCDVVVHGRVTGDVAIAFGKLQVDEGKSISGDVAAFATPITLEEGASIGGDLAAVGGNFTEKGATIHGNRVISSSPLWVLIPLAPILFVGGLIWLLITTIRNRTPMPPPYPGRYQRM